MPANQGGERKEHGASVASGKVPGGGDVQGEASLTKAKRGEGTCLLK